MDRTSSLARIRLNAAQPSFSCPGNLLGRNNGVKDMALIATLIILIALLDAGFLLWVYFSARHLPAEHHNHLDCGCPLRKAKDAAESPTHSE